VAQPGVFRHSSCSRNKLGLVAKAESKELELTGLFLAFKEMLWLAVNLQLL